LSGEDRGEQQRTGGWGGASLLPQQSTGQRPQWGPGDRNFCPFSYKKVKS